jgi:hypothetical protein
MPNDSKTYIVNDQATEINALDFTPYVETLADIIQTGNTPSFQIVQKKRRLIAAFFIMSSKLGLFTSSPHL